MIMLDRKTVIAAIAIISPSSALAAPFCLEAQGTPPECIYYDASECRTRAYEVRGLCIANPGEMIITPGSTGRYCLVLSSRHAQCLYADRTSCENDAGPAGGVCMEKTPGNAQIDPYRFDPNRTY